MKFDILGNVLSEVSLVSLVSVSVGTGSLVSLVLVSVGSGSLGILTVSFTE